MLVKMRFALAVGTSHFVGVFALLLDSPQHQQRRDGVKNYLSPDSFKSLNASINLFFF